MTTVSASRLSPFESARTSRPPSVANDSTRVPSRTIRYYQSKGALPKPTIRGRVAFYGPGHVERLANLAIGFTQDLAETTTDTITLDLMIMNARPQRGTGLTARDLRLRLFDTDEAVIRHGLGHGVVLGAGLSVHVEAVLAVTHVEIARGRVEHHRQ